MGKRGGSGRRRKRFCLPSAPTSTGCWGEPRATLRAGAARARAGRGHNRSSVQPLFDPTFGRRVASLATSMCVLLARGEHVAPVAAAARQADRASCRPPPRARHGAASRSTSTSWTMGAAAWAGRRAGASEAVSSSRIPSCMRAHSCSCRCSMWRLPGATRCWAQRPRRCSRRMAPAARAGVGQALDFCGSARATSSGAEAALRSHWLPELVARAAFRNTRGIIAWRA